ncbi:MAG: hypothetical protein AB3N64_05065 [Puniceicoccaceae bacterium]
MDPIQIKQALSEVRNLRKNILDKQLYKGYSGRARALGGCVALVASLIAGPGPLAPDAEDLFLMWGVVYLAAMLVNYGAVAAWILQRGNYRRCDHSVVFEMVPVWIVGGGLTLALWWNGEADLLYGTWMCLFGLAQGLNRLRLPQNVAWVGGWYITCGLICLIFAEGLFQQPLVMGLVFFAGEFAAGFIMHNSQHGGGVTGFLKLEGSIDE